MRANIVNAARDWLNTPYQHQASVKGVGCDCLGLVRGVWRDVCGDEPEVPPPYTPDWAEAFGQETLLEAARRHLDEKPLGQIEAGDVVLFRMGLGSPAKHAAIVSDAKQGHAVKIIHAYWGRRVVETHMSPWWQRRMAGSFSFPDN